VGGEPGLGRQLARSAEPAHVADLGQDEQRQPLPPIANPSAVSAAPASAKPAMRDDHSLARELLHATTRPITTRGYHCQLLATVGWTSLPLLPLVRQPTPIPAGADAWPDRSRRGSLDACCGCRSAGLDPQAAGHLPADAKETVPCHMTNTPRAGAGSSVPTG